MSRCSNCLRLSTSVVVLVLCLVKVVEFCKGGRRGSLSGEGSGVWGLLETREQTGTSKQKRSYTVFTLV